MSRRARPDALTGDLFAQIPQPWRTDAGGMDFRTQVATLVGQLLAETQGHDKDKDRFWVAGQVSRLVGKEVSKSMLDGYTAESRDTFNLPFYLVAPLESVCSGTLLTDWLAGVRGGRFLPGVEAIDAEIGRRKREMADAQAEIKQLERIQRMHRSHR